MRNTVRMVSAACLLAAVAAPAQGIKSCEELKAEIAAKLDANGVKIYTLEIVPAERAQAGQKVVGSCDGGKQRIVYRRGQQV